MATDITVWALWLNKTETNTMCVTLWDREAESREREKLPDQPNSDQNQHRDTTQHSNDIPPPYLQTLVPPSKRGPNSTTGDQQGFPWHLAQRQERWSVIGNLKRGHVIHGLSHTFVVVYKEFRPTMPEIHQLLGMEIKTPEHYKVPNKVETDDRKSKPPDNNHPDIADFRETFRLLQAANNGTTAEGLHHLTKGFAYAHRGTAKPADFERASTWKNHLCSAFPNALLPELSKNTKASCVW